MATPEQEHDFESIILANYDSEERENLSDEAQHLDRKRVQRQGPGILRRAPMFGSPKSPEPMPIECALCGTELLGEYWATKNGPMCPECATDDF